MVDAPFDAYLNTPNKSVRQNVPRKGVVLHHAAMTSFSGLEYLAMGGKQMSATAIAKDRISKQLMTDQFRAWSLSSAWGDSSFRSVETCNQSTDGWTISDASHWELAYLVAYWAERDGFWPHRNGDPKTWTVVGHREMYTIWGVSYATACPGGMDLNLVTARAQAILRASSTAGGETTPIVTPYYKKPYGRNSKEREMLAFIIIDGAGKLGPVGKTRSYVVGGGIFVDTTEHPTRNQVSVNVQGYDAEGKILPSPNLTYRELYDFAKGSGALTEDELAPYKSAAGLA